MKMMYSLQIHVQNMREKEMHKENDPAPENLGHGYFCST